MNKCHELPQTKVSCNKNSGNIGVLLIKNFVIQFYGSEEVTGFFFLSNETRYIFKTILYKFQKIT